ncbi:hypothetical protein IAQ61_003068 [Plenodomus lingam]|uniref:Uncharacterized protein n=1 Tax=Leptosphaeria maculans (strain JN3 / isolate v23.1.3 / race Av1-4-5-6-7-8) TaxID=985895 RepID=E5ADG0_LEPMJ|nr:hypothetical protein LEMA_P000360.1 [Plenodomus lingam JN3]KAH9875604.1 hypothetical protein IAQ61_003068 [Plenodomus lingam]CBY01249.1 hypothetical protein LEMA_P000360.1 [Plenodomus lingam JN3]
MVDPRLSLSDANLPDLQRRHVAAALSHSQPFPATPDGDLDLGTPSPETVVPCGLSSPSVNDIASLLDASLPQPMPLPSALPQPLLSPVHHDRTQSDLTAGLPLALPSPTVFRAAHKLRLPSFDVLGIAAPHPNRYPLHTSQSFSSLGAGPLSMPEDPLHALNALNTRLDLSPPHQGAHHHLSPTSPRATRGQLELSVATFTPPSELGTLSWGSFVNVTTTDLGSPPSSDSGRSPDLVTTTSATVPAQAPIIVPTLASPGEEVSMSDWVDQVKDMIITQSGCLDLHSVKILSHALPCPSMTGHVFGQIISTIHERTSAQTSWINVFHALPGRYTLSDLPKSPPSTPGPAVGGESYFTSKVFDSAVAIPDYQLDSKLLPPCPRPVVPPGSINVSVVERYIPPTNTNEYAEMFTFRGRSLLYDRLSELSTEDGILLFVYPTKTGARTFTQQYLGPILDPLLRTVTVVHDLHSELGRSLGQMSAVNYLDEYDHLQGRVRDFCHALGDRPGHQTATYKVIHAKKQEVILSRAAWADDWWIKQEKPRVRDNITKYFRKSKKLPSNEMTGAHLIQEVLEGVSKRGYHDGEPTKGVEVGVFIVKKMPST